MSRDIAPTARNMASVSSAVVLGTAATIGQARWNTPDGKKPSYSVRHTAASIQRPVTIKVRSVLSGTVEGEILVASLDGGRVGCDDYRYQPEIEVLEGQAYVFFLGAGVSADRGLVRDLRIAGAWRTTQAGVVSTPGEGNLSLDELQNIVGAVTPSPLPSPH